MSELERNQIKNIEEKVNEIHSAIFGKDGDINSGLINRATKNARDISWIKTFGGWAVGIIITILGGIIGFIYDHITKK